MAVEILKEKWPGTVSTLQIGATKEEGGTRSKSVKIGGQKTLPFLFSEGEIPYKPVVAYEIWDIAPVDWPKDLETDFAKVLKDPFAWLEKCVNEYKADLLCVRLQGTHPDFGNKKAEEAADFIKKLLKKTSLPLIIVGCGEDEKDNDVLPICSEVAKGERCLIGDALQDNYKTLTAACLADGHNIIAESPIDINIAKQLNILISDMSLPLEKIAINPTIGALGYGLEYAYSIMERARLAALSGDKTVASPFVCFVGQEAWKTKESKTGHTEQGILWEVLTSTALLQAGADVLVMRHPKACEKIRDYIDNLYAKR